MQRAEESNAPKGYTKEELEIGLLEVTVAFVAYLLVQVIGVLGPLRRDPRQGRCQGSRVRIARLRNSTT